MPLVNYLVLLQVAILGIRVLLGMFSCTLVPVSNMHGVVPRRLYF
jgi:hypothetical protein